MTGILSDGSSGRPSIALRPGQQYFEGTEYGHDPYMGPKSLTDVRPWADEAACKSVPHIFDAADGAKERPSSEVTGRARGPVELAKNVCAGCPAREVCLAEAMADETGGHQHRFSVRGGLTPKERAALWRQQQQ